MPQLHLSLLGSFQVTLDETPVSGITSPKIRALFAYLAVERRRLHSRETLAALLWPESPPGKATQNLRKSLSRLNEALTTNAASGSLPDFILADRHTVSLNDHAEISIDVARFSAAITFAGAHAHRNLQHCRRCAARLQEAAALYRGDFLQDVIARSGPFTEWVVLQREWLHRQALHALYTLAAHFQWLGDFSTAHRYAWRQVQIEPWNERGHRQVIRAHAALAQYQTLSQTLDAELDVAPSQESTRLFQDIANGSFRPQNMRQPASHVLHLPVHPTPFVGRGQELTEIAERLDATNCHLLTLVGPGGAGKSRLAAQIAREKADHFAAGACFVPLATLTQGRRLPTALLHALQVPLPEQQNSWFLQERLLDLLRDREMLPILDNYEQLLPESTLLQDILHHAPLVKVLVTSCRRLNLQAEWIVDVDGRAYPRSHQTPDPATFLALELFVQHARRLHPNFTPTTRELDAIIQICDAVAGIPLALELAAAHTRGHSVLDIAAGLKHNIDFLSSAMPDAGSRHHSLRAVFDHSWRLLDHEQRAVLQRLSIFQGGFSAAAAATVAVATPEHLSTLLDQSLVRLMQPEQLVQLDRYDLHPTIRQYAAETLSAQPSTAAETAGFHARYYATLLSDLVSSHSAASMTPESILPDLDNVRAAWEWAVSHEQRDILQIGLDGLAYFYARTGHLQEGYQALQSAAAVLQTASLDAASLNLHTRLLARNLFFLYGLARYDQAVATARTILQRTTASENGQLQAEAHLYWGMTLNRRGEYLEARPHLQDAHQQAQIHHLPRLEADSLRMVGQIELRVGNYAAAHDAYRRSLATCRSAGYRRGQAHALGGLGSVLLVTEKPLQARNHYQQALQIFAQAGDRRSQGEVLAHLCLLYHHQEFHETALNHGYQAVPIARETNDRSDLGYALTALKQLSPATAAYDGALRLRRELGEYNRTTEPLAGLALVALAQNDLPQALSHVEAILQHLQSGSLNVCDEPARVHLSCYNVLQAAGDPRAQPLWPPGSDYFRNGPNTFRTRCYAARSCNISRSTAACLPKGSHAL